MKTPHFDNEINELESLRSRGELTYMGGEALIEFNSIKQVLNTEDVSNQRNVFNSFFEYLDGLSRREFDDNSLTGHSEDYLNTLNK